MNVFGKICHSNDLLEQNEPGNDFFVTLGRDVLFRVDLVTQGMEEQLIGAGLLSRS